MPYIKPEDRIASLDIYIHDMAALLRNMHDLDVRKGPCNYTVTRLVLQAMKPDSGWSYHSISNAIAVLRDAATEMERRLMGPREDKAITTNGDIPEYA
jgi:hypothetical protein